jgi:hypothetical protein
VGGLVSARSSGNGRALAHPAVPAPRIRIWIWKRWRKRWTVAEWSKYLAAGESQTDLSDAGLPADLEDRQAGEGLAIDPASGKKKKSKE